MDDRKTSLHSMGDGARGCDGKTERKTGNSKRQADTSSTFSRSDLHVVNTHANDEKNDRITSRNR